MVVVPTLLTSVERVSELLEHLEVLALGNLDPRVHFAILSDFTDAPALEMPRDEAILSAARAGVEALNARHAEGRSDRFYPGHRRRQWNPGEGVFNGLGAQARQDRGVEPPPAGSHGHELLVEAGDASVFPAVRYCITLDSTRGLPRDAAKKLIGIAAHPLKPAPPRRGSRPRHRGLRDPPAPRERDHGERGGLALRAALRRPHRRRTPTRPRSPTPTRTSSPRGSSPARASTRGTRSRLALEGASPENALLSHDPLRGAVRAHRPRHRHRGRGRLPASVLAHAARQHRWVRGDWQILWWLFPARPPPAPASAAPCLPLVPAWKILDNLRRSLMAPATVACSLLAWTGPPGSPLVWTALVLAALASTSIRWSSRPSRPPPNQPLARLHPCGEEDAAHGTGAESGLQLNVPREPGPGRGWHAIGLTLVRLAATQRRLLEWETAAASAPSGGAIATALAPS